VGYPASTRRVTEGCRHGVVPTDAAGRMAGHQGHAAPVLPGRRKIRLTVSVRRNHWWNLPFHLTGRGITNRPMDQPGTQPGFAIDLDFVDQQLRIHTLDATPTPPSARLSCGRSVPRTWSIRFTSIWRRSRSSPSAAATPVPTTRAGRTLSTSTTATTQPYWSPRRLPGQVRLPPAQPGTRGHADDGQLPGHLTRCARVDDSNAGDPPAASSRMAAPRRRRCRLRDRRRVPGLARSGRCARPDGGSAAGTHQHFPQAGAGPASSTTSWRRM
jgi:hypothetical protein